MFQKGFKYFYWDNVRIALYRRFCFQGEMSDFGTNILGQQSNIYVF